MTLFNQKYRTQSARLKNWDYQNPGGYFITICSKNRQPYFGNCENGEMLLNEFGNIAYQFWKGIPEHFMNVDCGEFIIMPNHLHGILILNSVETLQCTQVETLQCNVSTEHNKNLSMSKISPKTGSISTIIRSYKSVCMKVIRQNFPDTYFEWQPRFYDHIIRNQKELERIENYIKANPSNWQKDELFI